MKKLVSALVMAGMLVFSTSAIAEDVRTEPSGGAIMFDVLITRPLGLVATAVGTTVFVIGLPFTIPTGSVGISAKKLIVEPLGFTFRRPVGEVHDIYVDEQY